MGEKDDAYLMRLSLKLTVGLVLVSFAAWVILQFFPQADLRIILIPLWILFAFLTLKGVYYFIKNYFSD